MAHFEYKGEVLFRGRLNDVMAFAFKYYEENWKEEKFWEYENDFSQNASINVADGTVLYPYLDGKRVCRIPSFFGSWNSKKEKIQEEKEVKLKWTQD